jgi:hypothetical protein
MKSKTKFGRKGLSQNPPATLLAAEMVVFLGQKEKLNTVHRSFQLFFDIILEFKSALRRSRFKKMEIKNVYKKLCSLIK